MVVKWGFPGFKMNETLLNVWHLVQVFVINLVRGLTLIVGCSGFEFTRSSLQRALSRTFWFPSRRSLGLDGVELGWEVQQT